MPKCCKPGCTKATSRGWCSYECMNPHKIRRNMRVYKLVQRAVADGRLVKPCECELCGSSKMLLAHHWHGYTDEHALNVWWVCHKCNTALSGPAYHNGSVSMEQAQKIIQDRIRQ